MVAKLKSSFFKNSFQLFCYKHLLSAPTAASQAQQPQPHPQSQRRQLRQQQMQQRQKYSKDTTNYEESNENNDDETTTTAEEIEQMSSSSPNLSSQHIGLVQLLIIIRYSIISILICLIKASILNLNDSIHEIKITINYLIYKSKL